MFIFFVLIAERAITLWAYPKVIMPRKSRRAKLEYSATSFTLGIADIHTCHNSALVFASLFTVAIIADYSCLCHTKIQDYVINERLGNP